MSLLEKIILCVNIYNEGISMHANDRDFLLVICVVFLFIASFSSFIFLFNPTFDMRVWLGLSLFLALLVYSNKERDNEPRSIYLDTGSAIWYARLRNSQPISLLPLYEDASFFKKIYDSEPNDEARAIETIRQLILYTIKARVMSTK